MRNRTLEATAHHRIWAVVAAYNEACNVGREVGGLHISQLEMSISKLVRHAALQDFARQTSASRGDGSRVHD